MPGSTRPRMPIAAMAARPPPQSTFTSTYPKPPLRGRYVHAVEPPDASESTVSSTPTIADSSAAVTSAQAFGVGVVAGAAAVAAAVALPALSFAGFEQAAHATHKAARKNDGRGRCALMVYSNRFAIVLPSSWKTFSASPRSRRARSVDNAVT